MALVLSLVSCEDATNEGRVTLQDTADLVDEALTEAYFQDVDDMAGLAIGSPTEDALSSGRTSGTIVIDDNRFKCDGVVITIVPDEGSTREHPSGVLTIDFGTGCEDAKGNVRKGKLIFTYDGKRFMPGASVVVTTEDYYINDVRLEGTRTLTNVQNSSADAPRFTAVLENGKAIFPNGLEATRESEITWQWNRAANPLNDNLQIEAGSNASGTTRLGRTYKVEVLEPLVFKRHCAIAVSGVKKYTVNDTKEITIDYGDGECDRKFTVEVNGESREIPL